MPDKTSANEPSTAQSLAGMAVFVFLLCYFFPGCGSEQSRNASPSSVSYEGAESQSSSSRASSSGVPSWYDSGYVVTNLDGWRSLAENHRRSFCLDCVAKLAGTIDVQKADAFEREVTDCSKVRGAGSQNVRELVATMWALDEKGGDITSMDDLLSDLVRLGR